MYKCNSVLQTQMDLFQPEIGQIFPKIITIDPISDAKTFGHFPVRAQIYYRPKRLI